MHAAGGLALLAQRLQQLGLLHEDCHTVDGRTIGEIAAAARETEGQEVIRSAAAPLKDRGGIAILRGALAPEGCVVKLAGHDRTRHAGPARVFDGEEACFAAVQALGGTGVGVGAVRPTLARYRLIGVDAALTWLENAL